MSNVKLAVRLRPFTEREQKSEKEYIPVVSVVDEHTVFITNIKVSLSGAGDSRERVRSYYADYTFDSSCPVTEPNYASQEKVFETIGRQVVSSMSRGLSACVLAYGQSATGKTYTMMGSDGNPGLVPRICKALTEDSTIGITVSFLEIYNERVHDLLVGDVTCHSLPRRRGNARKDLRVREHPTRGPYVQNLRRVAVNDIESLLSLVEEGARRRRTAATRQNPSSSRSHAVLELATDRCTVHLADLAGSEKASWEGCGGGRQKEGANINKSLVALSNVISALVSGGSRGRFVPYRDSALTWLLKDCFTGGASTFIIATLSPSSVCYGESASTLRWAARARQLPMLKAQTSTPSSTSKAALQAQLNQLLAELARNYIQYIPETGKLSYDDDHWTLNIKYNSQSCGTTKAETKIGNLLNMLNDPNAEVQKSESPSSSVIIGNSNNTNIMNKNIKEEISKEVDKVFGPALERTRSGGEIEITAPLRNKKRQYKSQEVLPIDKSVQGFYRFTSSSQEKLSQQEESSDIIKKPPVPIFYDNQRAEIVASVTERLYSKLKKKEEAAVAKVESVVDRKIMEPLSELRICTNARQRLMELSQRAMRNKRRIGIPAHTQTRVTVIRVKDQGIDVQTDLYTYILPQQKTCILQRDVSTETTAMTPRCKEIAVGSKYGYLSVNDRSTLTENKQIIQKNSFSMTDNVSKYDCCTQTPIVPPPRRKKRVPNAPVQINGENINKNCVEVQNPMISINISQHYPVDSDTQSSDDNTQIKNSYSDCEPVVNIEPDLLKNHNTVIAREHETISLNNNGNELEINQAIGNLTSSDENVHVKGEEQSEKEEFPESAECSLPRVRINLSQVAKQDDIKDIILGRNENMYPYNIILSPPRERDETKRVVKFKDITTTPTTEWSNTEWEWEDDNNYSEEKSNSDVKSSEKESDGKESCVSIASDSTSPRESKSFVWRPQYYVHQTTGESKGYTPVAKTYSRNKTTRSRIYKEFLGLDNYQDPTTYTHRPKFSSLTNFKDLSSSDSTDNEIAIDRFNQRRLFFENKVKTSSEEANEKYDIMEKKILDACRDLDMSVNKYESYLTKYRHNTNTHLRRTPTEYLQHLVRIRREVVKAEFDTTDN